MCPQMRFEEFGHWKDNQSLNLKVTLGGGVFAAGESTSFLVQAKSLPDCFPESELELTDRRVWQERIPNFSGHLISITTIAISCGYNLPPNLYS